MTPFSAVLLCGGKSTRMGRDKALLDWHGRPLWQAQLHKLQSVGAARVLLSCRREQSLFVHEGVETVHDPAGVDDGPLGAITRCLERVQMPLLVLAVDMPWMTAAFLREHLVPAAEPVRGQFYRGSHGDEVLAGLYVPAMLPLMQAALREKHLALQPIIEACVKSGSTVTREMSEDQSTFFRNANTAEDLK